MADPGFPGGANLKGGSVNLLFGKMIVKNCMKMKEIKPTWGTYVPRAPLGSATVPVGTVAGRCVKKLHSGETCVKRKESQSVTLSLAFSSTNPERWFRHRTRYLYNKSGRNRSVGTDFSEFHHSMARIGTSDHRPCFTQKMCVNYPCYLRLFKRAFRVRTRRSGFATAPPMDTMNLTGIFFWPISRKSIKAWRESELLITMPEKHLSFITKLIISNFL